MKIRITLAAHIYIKRRYKVGLWNDGLDIEDSLDNEPSPETDDIAHSVRLHITFGTGRIKELFLSSIWLRGTDLLTHQKPAPIHQ